MHTTEILKKIEGAAKAANTEIRDASSLRVGECARQGDVYLWRMRADVLRGSEMRGAKARQLAPGTSRGSRHVVEGDAEVFANGGARPKACTDRALLGPMIVTGKSGATVTHPEHAHVSLPPNTTWQVTYQLDWQTQRAVVD